jgi:uncharacterized membrane protein
MHLQSLFSPVKIIIAAMLALFVATPASAAGKNNFQSDEPAAIDDADSGTDQTLDHNFSPEDRARLRKALADYAKSTDPEHNQIEQKRKAMKQSIEARFIDCDEDADDSLDREEATACLPQVARHFNFVDVDEDGVITLEELQLAQAKSVERQKAAEAKIEAQKILEAEAEIRSKSKSKTNKQAATLRKHPS